MYLLYNMDMYSFIMMLRYPGVMNPKCKFCLFMGKSEWEGSRHQQHSIVIVPLDSPGLTVVRTTSVFGYTDAPREFTFIYVCCT